MDVMDLRRRIMLNEPHIVTPASAGLQNFKTDMIAPLKECKVHFSPVQEGTGDPSPSNVRAISGWTGVEVYRTGKNLFDKSAAVIGKWLNVNTGVEESTTTSYALSDYIPVKSGVTYVMLQNPQSSRRWLYDKDKNPLAKIPNISFTASVDGFCRITISTLSVGIDTFQIEVGSTATPYKTYIGTILPIDWATEAGTVYGGYVDLMNGEVVETWGGVTLNSSMNAYISGTSYRGTNCTDVWFDPGAYAWGYTTSYVQLPAGNSYSDKLKLSDKAIWGSPDLYPWCYTLNSYNQIHCVFVNSVVGITNEDTNSEAIEKTKTWIDANPIVIKYKLSDSKATNYSITPQTLKTLRGTNNIWSNANDNIELAYWSH